MVMIMTVLPANGAAVSPADLTQAFDIEDASGLSVEERLMSDGAIDEILRFVSRCQRRFVDVVGETVVFVNFREAIDAEGWMPRALPSIHEDFAPSMN